MPLGKASEVHAVMLLYMISIKALLGVRQTTANDISLLEIGVPLKHWVKQKQLNFLKQALHHREGLDDDPLTFDKSLNTAAKTLTGLYNPSSGGRGIGESGMIGRSCLIV